jgi:hypothetical protein
VCLTAVAAKESPEAHAKIVAKAKECGIWGGKE